MAPGSRIQLGRVLALKQGGQFSVGQPYVEGATVEAEVLEELQGPKVCAVGWAGGAEEQQGCGSGGGQVGWVSCDGGMHGRRGTGAVAC